MAAGHPAGRGALRRSASTVMDGYSQKRIERGGTHAGESYASHVDTSENDPGADIIKRLTKSPAGRLMAKSPGRNPAGASAVNEPAIITHGHSSVSVQRKKSNDSNMENAKSRVVPGTYAQAPPAKSTRIMPHHADVILRQAQTAKPKGSDKALSGSPQTGMTPDANVPDSAVMGRVSHGSGESPAVFVQNPWGKTRIETHNTAAVQQKADTPLVQPVPGRQTRASAYTEISAGHIFAKTTGTALSDMNGNQGPRTAKNPQTGPGQSPSAPDHGTAIINRLLHGPGGWTIRYMGGISLKHKGDVAATGNIIQRRAVSHGQNQHTANPGHLYGIAADQGNPTMESPAAALPGHVGISIIQRYTEGHAGRAMSVPAGPKIFHDLSRDGTITHNTYAREKVSGLSEVYTQIHRSTMPPVIQHYPDMRLTGDSSSDHGLNSFSNHAQTAVTPAFVQTSPLSMPLQRSQTVMEHSQLKPEAPQAAVQRSASQQAVSTDGSPYQPVDESSGTGTSITETQNQPDIEEMADRVYAIIEERLIIERESLGLR